MRRRTRSQGLGAVLVALLVFALPAGWKQSLRAALQQGLLRLSPPRGQLVQAPADSGRLRLQALEARCAWLEAELQRKASELTAFGAFRTRFPRELAPRAVSARVLLHADAASSFRRGWLSAGSRDGVSEGDLVVQGDILLGRIVEVGEAGSQVMWLNDPEFRVRAQALPPAGSTGEAVTGVGLGNLEEGLLLSLLSSPRLALGSPVLADPQGFLCGWALRVGQVKQIEKPIAATLPRVSIELALDPAQIELVQIMQPQPSLQPTVEIPWGTE